MDLHDISADIFLIRHGDPATLENHWTSPDSPLSDSGVKNTKKLAKTLRSHFFDILITSPLMRAKETAAIIRDEISSIEDFRQESWVAEIDLGEFSGLHRDEIKQKFPSWPKIPPKIDDFPAPLVARLLVSNKDYSFPNGESLLEFWNRVSTGFQKFLDHIKETNKHSIGIIGHGGSFTVIILSLIGKSFTERNFPVFFFNKSDLFKIKIYQNRVLLYQQNPQLE